MTTEQQDLFSGDLGSQRRFALSAILDDTLRMIRTTTFDTSPRGQDNFNHALRLVREVADELRLLGDEEGVPF